MDNIKYIDTIINVINNVSFALLVYYTNFKIVNRKISLNMNECLKVTVVILISAFLGITKYEINYLISLICLLILIALLFSINDIIKSFLVTIVSLGINYIINIFAIFIVYNFNYMIKEINDYINIIIIKLLELTIIYFIFKTRKLKYGFTIFKDFKNNEYIDVLTLNISVSILFSVTIFFILKIEFIKNIVFVLMCFGIVMFKTIQKSIELYYKQKLLIKELNETKIELEDKKKEIALLEEENLSFSKKSHSLAHKQKVLEYKINKLLLQMESAEELDLKDKAEAISKELYKDSNFGNIEKTGIINIDDMLDAMKEECIKNKIEFNVQIYGNIYKMINNYVDKKDLEILLADHIKDAIIAINHTENINRSILVKLGKIDDCYGIYLIKIYWKT